MHLDLSFVQGDKNRSICILLPADLQLDQHHLLKMLSFSTVWFWLLYQRSSNHRCVGLFLDLQFYSIDLPVCLCTNTMWFLSLLLYSIYSLKSGMVIPSEVLLLLRIVFAMLGFFVILDEYSR